MNKGLKKLRFTDNLFGAACLFSTVLFFNAGPLYLWSLPALLLVAMFISASEWFLRDRKPLYLTFWSYFGLAVSYLILILGMGLAVSGVVRAISINPEFNLVLQGLWPQYADGRLYLLILSAVFTGAVFVGLSNWAIGITRYMYPLDFGNLPPEAFEGSATAPAVRQGIDKDPQ